MEYALRLLREVPHLYVNLQFGQADATPFPPPLKAIFFG